MKKLNVVLVASLLLVAHSSIVKAEDNCPTDFAALQALDGQVLLDQQNIENERKALDDLKWQLKKKTLGANIAAGVATVALPITFIGALADNPETGEYSKGYDIAAGIEVSVIAGDAILHIVTHKARKELEQKIESRMNDLAKDNAKLESEKEHIQKCKMQAAR